MPRFTGRLLRCATLLVLLANALVTAPGRVAALDLEGDEYTDEVFGWSVAIDLDVWEPSRFSVQADERFGLSLLALERSVSAKFYPYPGDDFADVDDCLAALEESVGRTNDQLRLADDFDAPRSDPDAAGGVYTGMDAVVVTQEVIIYLECRQLDDAFLTFTLKASDFQYDQMIEPTEELLAAVTPLWSEEDTPEADDDETPERDEETPAPVDDEISTSDDVREPDPDAGELAGDTFTDTALGYSVSWDEDVWTPELLEGAGTAGIALASDFASIVIDAFNGYDGIDADQCVADLAEAFEDFDGYSSLREAQRVEGPEPPRDGAGTVYSFTFTNDDEEFDRVAYIECRPIDDQTMIRVSILSNEDLMEDNVDAFQDVLDSIEIDEPVADETPDPDDEETPEPDAAGGTFVNEEVGLLIEYDDDLWTPFGSPDDTTFAASAQTDAGNMSVTVEVRPDADTADLDDCLAEFADELAGVADVENLEEARRLDLPESDPTAVGAAYTYLYSPGESGGDDWVSYIECRPLIDGGALRIELQTLADAYPDQLDPMSDFLAGVQVVEPSAVTVTALGGGAATDIASRTLATEPAAGRRR